MKLYDWNLFQKNPKDEVSEEVEMIYNLPWIDNYLVWEIGVLLFCLPLYTFEISHENVQFK